jgi:hypothetical protein
MPGESVMIMHNKAATMGCKTLKINAHVVENLLSDSLCVS